MSFKYNFPPCDRCVLLCQGERSLLALYVRHIHDLNEITSHMLEVVRSQLGLLGKVIGLVGRDWSKINYDDKECRVLNYRVIKFFFHSLLLASDSNHL